LEIKTTVDKLQNQKEPKATKKEITKTSQIGTKETRATFIVNEDLLENEIVGLLGSSLIKDVNNAFEEHIARYEKKRTVK
jgi:hypothetical protein